MKKTMRRAGMAMILILVALAVLAIVLTVATTQVLTQRRLAQQRNRQLQADWLAHAGIELAAAKLLDNPAPFSVEYKDVVKDGIVRVVVEKSLDGAYTIHADAELKLEGTAGANRARSARFRRIDEAGSTRLQALAIEHKK